MLLLYRWLWAVLLPLLRLSQPLTPRSWGLKERFSVGKSENPQPDATFWLHGASLGEARALWALARNLEWEGRILLTTTTVSGRDWLQGKLRKERESPRRDCIRVRLAPLDHPAGIRSFLSVQRVRTALFYEMELWPHALAGLREAGCPAFWVSARLTPRAARIYGVFPKTFRKLLGHFAFIQAQSAEDAKRLAALGTEPSDIGCDLKAAYYLEHPPDSGSPRRGIAFLSVHAREMRQFLGVLPALMEKSPIFILPRREDEFGIFRKALAPLGFLPFSQGGGGPHLLVDALGQTENFLSQCHSVFAGGTLVPVGGHNLWEPLRHGLKVYLGPHRFHQEPLASALLENGLAETVSDPGEARNWVSPGPEFPGLCRAFSERESAKAHAVMERLNRVLRSAAVHKEVLSAA